MKANKVILSITISVLILVVFGICYYTSTSIDYKNKEFLKSYGWKSITGGLDSSYDFKGTYIDLNNNILHEMAVSASEEIHLNPKEYIGKRVDINIYSYDLGKVGDTQSLHANLWVYDKKIIGAYIWHSEPNIKVRFWSLNTPYSDIVSYIQKEKNFLRNNLYTT